MTLHFIDVGARKGRTAALLLKNPDPNIRAYLFEPDPFLMERLKEKFSTEKRVSLYEEALTNFTGNADFFGRERGGEGNSLYAEKKTSIGAPCIQVRCRNMAEFLRGIPDGPIVLYSNCEGSEFDFMPQLLNSELWKRISLWSVSFHHGDRKIPSMKPAYFLIEAKMKELGIENVLGHFGKGDIKAGKLDEFVERVCSFLT